MTYLPGVWTALKFGLQTTHREESTFFPHHGDRGLAATIDLNAEQEPLSKGICGQEPERRLSG